jgi:hypothetical protein
MFGPAPAFRQMGECTNGGMKNNELSACLDQLRPSGRWENVQMEE